MPTTERSVRPDPSYLNGCYIITAEHGVSCLGFDVCLDRISRYYNELVGRGVDTAGLPETTVTRGTMAAYDTMRNLTDLLQKVCEAQGERATSELTPQLVGLEGWRVEVVDTFEDTPRRFIVGKSTGWLPVHLEIARRDSSGGGAAMREYKSVDAIEKIR
jgi:hypothetical protein